MEYLNYNEYISLGGECDETTFNRFIDRASAVIDMATQNRIWKMAKVPKRAKTLCRDLVEYFATNLDFRKKDVASRSESAGVVSESVSYSQKDNETTRTEIKELIEDHLYMVTDDFGTPLLYKGAMG